MTQLQADLHALQQQHQSQTAQMGKDKQRLLANIGTLEDQSAQLQGKLDMQRCASVQGSQNCKSQFCCLILFMPTLFRVFWLQAERTRGRRRGQAAA